MQYNSPEDQAKCPLNFGYMPYANGFLVTSDVSKNIMDRVFLHSSHVPSIERLCGQQTSCDHTACEYKQEIIRALQATTCVFDSSKKPVDTPKAADIEK